MRRIAGLGARFFSNAAREHSVWRVDYNHNVVAVKAGLSKQDAEKLAQTLQDRGHHQTYYATSPQEARQLKADYTSPRQSLNLSPK